MNESGGGTAADVQGDNEASLGPTFATGKVGAGLDFNGLDHHVRIADTPSLELAEGTFDFWFNRNDTYDSSVLRMQKMLDKADGFFTVALLGTEVNGFAAPFNTASAGSLGFYMYNGTSSHLVTSTQTTWDAGTWYHVAGTWGSSGMTLYVNGVQVGTNSYTGGFADVANGWSIGGNLSGADRMTNAIIDEVDLFDRALAANEIQDLFDAGSDGKCKPEHVAGCISPPANLVSWWPLDGAENSVTSDLQGSNDGTVVPGQPVFTTGHVGNGLEFDGVNDLVDVEYDSSLDFVGAFSIDMWLKLDAAQSFDGFGIIDKSIHPLPGAHGLGRSRCKHGVLGLGEPWPESLVHRRGGDPVGDRLHYLLRGWYTYRPERQPVSSRRVHMGRHHPECVSGRRIGGTTRVCRATFE
ncbi:MAG: LamG domain-containing protein [Fuerstiella sp.]|nr:LamG domain-containing protein [Fuerstiella sp.]MCP4857017.1 LamG domain-containing protein [Fuerstiella sp.]